MQTAQTPSFKPTILVEYRSPAPTVTHVRGGVIVQSLASLRHAGLYDAYVARLDPRHRDDILYAIAASWIPVETGMAHLDALDQLELADSQMVNSGASVGREFGTLVYSAVMKATRSVGANAGWFLLKQCDRLLPRVYTGGGCTLIQTGPKDAVLELHGMTMARSRFFRTSHQAYMTALGRLMGSGAYVRRTRARDGNPQSLATAFSWV